MQKKSKSNGSRRKYRIPAKTCWHIYSLQALNGSKFAQVVNKVLRKEFLLIK